MVEYSDQFKYSALFFWDFFEENNQWIVSNVSFNGIFKIDMSDYKSEFVRTFDKENGIVGLHKQILLYQDSLIFIPGLAENVAFVDKMTMEAEYVSIVLENSVPGEAKVTGACIWRGKLWLFPLYLSQDIIRIDLPSKTLRPGRLLKDLIGEGAACRGPMFGTPAFKENLAFIPVTGTNCIVRLDMDKAEASVERLSRLDCRINSIDAGAESFWLTFCDSTEIMEWKPGCGTEVIYHIPAEWGGEGSPFSRVVSVSGEECLIFPAHTESFWLREKNRFHPIEYPAGFQWVDDFKRDWTRCHSYKKKGNWLYILPSTGNMLLTYDTVEKKMGGAVCRVPDGWDQEFVVENHLLPYYRKKQFRDQKVLYETEVNSLELFIGCLEMNPYQADGGDRREIGAGIYEYLKAMVLSL